ncbi:MAG: PilW family protein [Pseudomonadota bacterium]
MTRGARPGFSLVELMVALAISLAIVLVAAALLLASNGSYLDHTETARLHDNARYALEIVTRAVRQSAYVNWDGTLGPVGVAAEEEAAISGLDARSVNKNGEGIDNVLEGAVNGSDVLAIRYAGAGAGAAGDGSVINCAGFGVGLVASPAERGWSIFYVGTDATGEAELRCKYRGQYSWGADAIVRGVDSFQVLYGLDTDTPTDGVANQYINASALNELDAALVVAGTDAAERERERRRQTHWKRVVSIRIALLLHGEPGSGTGTLPGRFDLFGEDYATGYGASDAGVHVEEQSLAPGLRARARQLVETTVVLRNRPG